MAHAGRPILLFTSVLQMFEKTRSVWIEDTACTCPVHPVSPGEATNRRPTKSTGGDRTLPATLILVELAPRNKITGIVGSFYQKRVIFNVTGGERGELVLTRVPGNNK